jgi:hypothetical protein
MKARLISIKGNWTDVKNSCMVTVSKEYTEKEPDSSWRKKILLAEHSPIRQILIKCKLEELKSWISVHFIRHKIGIEHWVRSQRTDRTMINRDELKQSELIEHEFEANCQAFINISRKRLCNIAARETREAWKEVLEKIKDEQPELYSVCVPDCIYRGWCYEMKSCNYYITDEYKKKLNEYRKN